MRSLKNNSSSVPKETGVDFFYNKILLRLRARCNCLGRLPLREAIRILSLAMPLTKVESETILFELQKAGTLQIEGRELYLKRGEKLV